MRYRLRTLLIVLAIGPPIVAWAWFHRLPLLIILAVCLFGTALALALLWSIQGLLAIASLSIASLQRTFRRKNDEGESEFSLSSYTAKLKAGRKR